jgi:hypothetical protein
MDTPGIAPADVRLRHRVDAALVERMASGDAPHRQPPATASPEPPDRLSAVVRAGGLVPAARHHAEERPDGHLVDPDERQAEVLHAWARAATEREADVIAEVRAARRPVKGISEALPGRLTTMSRPGCAARTGAMAARSRRRARFRLTAPRAPGIANAARDMADSPETARSRSTPERASVPCSRTAAIRRRPERRCRRFIAERPESGACGPCGAVP